MRRIAILLLLTGIALPSWAAKRVVTVAQLESALNEVRGKRDTRVAEVISGMELSERLTPAKLSRWQARLPGEKSRKSLEVLADLSAFLDPPAAEIPTRPMPNFAEQSRIMELAVNYAKETLHKLPNFFARRDTVLFEDNPSRRLEDMARIVVPYEPIHEVNKTSVTVLYRDGAEVVDAGRVKRGKYDPNARILTTHGVFGPILSTTLVDAANGEVTWSRWEQGLGGPEAVFHFSVPRSKSHYQVAFCCFEDNTRENREFRKMSGYHGEIAIDPADGSILRLTLVADLDPADPVGVSNIMVEYAPVEIGGRNYICPIKNVSIWVTSPEGPNALQTLLNDVDFAQYHLFRSEARILFGSDPVTP
jgi:hypothetical protein